MKTILQLVILLDWHLKSIDLFTIFACWWLKKLKGYILFILQWWYVRNKQTNTVHWSFLRNSFLDTRLFGRIRVFILPLLATVQQVSFNITDFYQTPCFWDKCIRIGDQCGVQRVILLNTSQCLENCCSRSCGVLCEFLISNRHHHFHICQPSSFLYSGCIAT